MDPLVQSALEAANQGEKPKAAELVKQVLSANSNDMDAWLVLATIVDDPQRKRQCLNHVLSLDATNKTAREMLLEMDRAELNSYRSQPITSPLSTTPSQSDNSSPRQSSLPQKSPSLSSEKSLVFQYSRVWLVGLYLFMTVFCCMGLLFASQSISSSTPPLILALLFGLSALSVSSKVEVKEAGIRTASLLVGSSEIKWNEIASIRSNSVKKKIGIDFQYRRVSQSLNTSEGLCRHHRTSMSKAP